MWFLRSLSLYVEWLAVDLQSTVNRHVADHLQESIIVVVVVVVVVVVIIIIEWGVLGRIQPSLEPPGIH